MRVQRRKHAATRVACRLESVADPTALLGCRMVTSHLSARGKWERDTEIGRRSESGREVRARRANCAVQTMLRRGLRGADCAAVRLTDSRHVLSSDRNRTHRIRSTQLSGSRSTGA